MYESIGSAKRPLSAMELSTTSVSGEDGKQRRSLAQLPPLPPKEISEAEPIVQVGEYALYRSQDDVYVV